MANIIDTIQLSGTVYTLQGSGGTVSSAITSGDTNAVAGGAVYDKFDEVEQVTARALNDLDEKKSSTVELTQEEYDALTTKDPNTYYVITDATPIDVSTFVTSGQMTSAITQATSGKVDSSSIVSSVTSASTDSEIPTAKAVYDAIPTGGTGGGKAISAGTNISVTTGETADTINCTLNARNGTGTNSFIYGSNQNLASGNQSHSEGYATQATGQGSHSEGYYSKAKANWSHSEGESTTANGSSSHSEGKNTTAGAYGAHSEGYGTSANAEYSHTEGAYTVTKNKYEHSQGQYNVSSSASTTFGNSGNTLFSVGNGTSSSARHNAFEIRQNGDIYLSSGGTDIKLQDYLGGGSITVDTALDSASTNPVENRVIYNKIDEVEQVTARALNELNDTFGGLKLVKLTQAEYNALATKDSSTLYIIVN